MWDLIVSVPDHCLSFYFPSKPFKTIQYIHDIQQTFFPKRKHDPNNTIYLFLPHPNIIDLSTTKQ